jgi:arylsulfatase A-like enzyme
MPEVQPTIAESLTEMGYETVLITDTFHQFRASMNFQRGFNVFDFVRGQEIDHYRSALTISDKAVDRLTIPGNAPIIRDKIRQYLANNTRRQGEEDYFAPQVFQRAVDFLEDTPNMDAPFFLVVDSFDPHEPWDPPQKYANMYSDPIGNREPSAPNYDTTDYVSEKELDRMAGLYAGEVTMTDRWLGKFLDKMEEMNLTENTLLLIISDHGVQLGEHGLTGKVYSGLFPELTDVPFLIRHPEGKGAGKTSDFYASTHDIAPTVLAAVDLERPQQMEGQDLTPILEGREPETPRPHFTIGQDNYSLARDDDYAMMCPNDREWHRLYDLRKDPKMDKDIAANNSTIVKKMYKEYIVADAGGEPPQSILTRIAPGPRITASRKTVPGARDDAKLGDSLVSPGVLDRGSLLHSWRGALGAHATRYSARRPAATVR